MNPFLPLNNKRNLIKRLFEEFKAFNIIKKEIEVAVEKAWMKDEIVKEDIRKKGEEVLEYIKRYW